MNIISDVFLLDKLQILENKGTMKIRGIFQRADEANANKRVYKKSILEKSIKSLKPMIENRMLVGELDHPAENSVRLSNSSHLITKLEMKGNEMIGEAEILNTPAGKIAQTLISDGVKIGISSRGTGTISEDKEGVKYVNEDFKLITFDLVADPSTRGAFPGLSEAKKVDMDEVIKKTFGEKVLIAMIKEGLESETVDEGSANWGRTLRVRDAIRNKQGGQTPTAHGEKLHQKLKSSNDRHDAKFGPHARSARLPRASESKIAENLKQEILKRSRIKKD